MTQEQRRSLMQRQNEEKGMVNRLKNTAIERFHDLVVMHLAFKINLDAPGSREQILESAEQPSPVETPSKVKRCDKFLDKIRSAKKQKPAPSSEPTEIFGVPLSRDVLNRIFPLINFLQEERSLKTPGIFRRSGSSVRQDTLKARLNANEDLKLEDFSPLDVACVLKAFLGNLPEPLFPHRQFHLYHKVIELTKPENQLAAMQLLIQLLPLDSFILLEYLLGLLNAVLKEPANHMDDLGLGICMGPSLFQVVSKQKQNSTDIEKSKQVNDVVKYILKHAAEVTKVPHSLVDDVRNYWHSVECSTPTSGHIATDGPARAQHFQAIMSARHNIETGAVSTLISFADQTQSQKLAGDDYTQNEVEKLLSTMSEEERNKYLEVYAKSVKKLGRPCHNLSTPQAASATPKPKRFAVRTPHKLFNKKTPRHPQPTPLACPSSSPHQERVLSPPPKLQLSCSPTRPGVTSPAPAPHTDSYLPVTPLPGAVNCSPVNCSPPPPPLPLTSPPVMPGPVHVVDMDPVSGAAAVLSNGTGAFVDGAVSNGVSNGVSTPADSNRPPRQKKRTLSGAYSSSIGKHPRSRSKSRSQTHVAERTPMSTRPTSTTSLPVAALRSQDTILDDKENQKPPTEFKSPNVRLAHCPRSSLSTPSSVRKRRVNSLTNAPTQEDFSPISSSVKKASISVQQSVSMPGCRNPVALVP